MKIKRVCIYPKDVQLITGKSERYGRLLLRRIRKHSSKKPYSMVSIVEFCEYTELDIEQVMQLIID